MHFVEKKNEETLVFYWKDKIIDIVGAKLVIKAILPLYRLDLLSSSFSLSYSVDNEIDFSKGSSSDIRAK
jgi:hypothetical protein